MRVTTTRTEDSTGIRIVKNVEFEMEGMAIFAVAKLAQERGVGFWRGQAQYSLDNITTVQAVHRGDKQLLVSATVLFNVAGDEISNRALEVEDMLDRDVTFLQQVEKEHRPFFSVFNHLLKASGAIPDRDEINKLSSRLRILEDKVKSMEGMWQRMDELENQLEVKIGNLLSNGLRRNNIASLCKKGGFAMIFRREAGS